MSRVDTFESSTGIGVCGVIDQQPMALGNKAWIHDLGVIVETIAEQAEELRQQGASVVYLAVKQKLAGLIAVSDPVKASTAEALAALRVSGIRVVIASGDGLTTAKAVATKLGIDEVYGEVKPADKLALVEGFQKAAAWSPWPVTASTMHLRWQRRTLVLRCAPEQM